MTKSEGLSTEQMFLLCNGDESSCNFDFSIISQALYSNFFGGLGNLLFKKVKCVGFNCDLASKVVSVSDKSIDDDETINGSIMRNKPRYIQYLMKVLRVVLPSTRLLQKLYISSIPLPEIHVTVLFTAVVNCPTLKSLCLNDIRLGDKNVSFLLTMVSPFRFVELMLTNCGLTSRVFPYVYQMLKRKPADGEQWKLRTLDVGGNQFSDKEVQKIRELMERALPTERREPIVLSFLSEDEMTKALEEEDDQEKTNGASMLDMMEDVVDSVISIKAEARAGRDEEEDVGVSESGSDKGEEEVQPADDATQAKSNATSELEPALQSQSDPCETRPGLPEEAVRYVSNVIAAAPD